LRFFGKGMKKRRTNRRLLIHIAILLIACFLLLSCSPKERGRRRYRLKIKDVQIQVELAVTDAERRRGLQRREELPEGRGMLFCYPESRRRTFWMKDTSVALSIAFIEYSGSIAQIEGMEPLSEKKITSDIPVKYALEVPRGFFQRHGIKERDTVIIPEEIKRMKVR